MWGEAGAQGSGRSSNIRVLGNGSRVRVKHGSVGALDQDTFALAASFIHIVNLHED